MREPGDIAAWVGKALNKALGDRLAVYRELVRDGLCLATKRDHRGCRVRENHIGLLTD